MRVLAPVLLVLAVATAPAGAIVRQDAPLGPEESQPEPARSVAVGKPWNGRLRNGVQLPVAGPDFMSWDAISAGPRAGSSGASSAASDTPATRTASTPT